tara:strand:- start:111 stop:584 length:474 start_codon:yes stop_codon:yes gene_type:complete
MEIQGYPNYLIYQDGRVWSNIRKGKFLKHAVNHGGYHRVGLSRDNKGKYFSVHRLVAIHFIANPDNKPEVDHINRDRSDNRVENLRWVTRLENGQNTGKQTNNTSGHKNIYYKKKSDSWKFEKRINKVNYQKIFRTKTEAICYKFCFILSRKYSRVF